MSNYVSDKIAANIGSINTAQKLLTVIEQYNLDMLGVIGEDVFLAAPKLEQDLFVNQLDSLRSGLQSDIDKVKVDSVTCAFNAYMHTSMEVEEAYVSRFIDTRDWYFNTLQPRFQNVRMHIEELMDSAYEDLKMNSEQFQQGFYRSIIPGVVSVAAGIMLVILMMFYLSVYYVNPIYKMLEKLHNYREHSIRYHNDFEGDDQLSELNEQITDLATENYELRKRIAFRKRHESEEQK